MEVKIFENPSFGKVRTMGTAENPLFCLSDVCKILDIGNPSDVKNRLDKGVVTIEPLETKGGVQQVVFVNEDGLYDVILDSRKPEARAFRKWITSEVLPSIRKTGSYTVPQMSDREIALQESKQQLERAKLLTSLANKYSGKYEQILDAHATKELCGEFLLPLPESKEKTYSATEVGQQLGITAFKVGRLANANNLKTSDYGEWVWDKKRNSGGEVQTFRYNQNGIKAMQNMI